MKRSTSAVAQTRNRGLARLTLVALSAAAALGLSGCGLSSSAVEKVTSPTSTGNAAVSGTVMGGQQPVAGVSLRLYMGGTAGYGSAMAPISSVFNTTPGGNFNLPSFSCTSGTQLFIVGTGGTPIGGSANPNLALMASLGLCDNFNPSSFININELTTLAVVYALNGFMTGPTNIGSPSNPAAVSGFNNAAATINKLVRLTNGTAPGPTLPASATFPTYEFNALGNVLQNCVNSAGGVASDTTDGVTNGTPCGKLFFLTTRGGVAPTDTITAALNLASQPSVNVANLNKLQASSPAFLPAYSVNASVVDWALAITYSAGASGGGLSSPQSVATDAAGNVWITNKTNYTGCTSGTGSVTKLNNTGAAVSGACGFTSPAFSTPWSVAIDTAGAAWVTSSGNNALVKVSSDGSSTTSYAGNGLNTPKGIAIDGAGDLWVANSGVSTVSAFTSTGATFTGSPFGGGGISNPTAIAVNPK